MRSTAAQVVGERVFDLCFRRLLGPGEERGRLHNHAVDAIAALHRLFLDEGALHRVQAFGRAEAFERHHLLLRGQGRERRHARAHRLAVDVDRAGTALRQPAAEARAVQREVVAQRIKQRHVGIGIDRMSLTVDLESEALTHGRVSFRSMIWSCVDWLLVAATCKRCACDIDENESNPVPPA